MSDLLKAANISKIYKQGGEKLTVLHDISFNLKAGEIVALVGPSGSGKSTLLHIAGLLDQASAGSLEIEGRDATKLKEADRTRLRRYGMGFIYQFHYLQPEFSALENLVIPQMISDMSRKDAEKHGAKLLEDVGLGHRLDHRPARLSGGEQQRVAIARALINKPKILLADEPTGNLDPETSDRVFDMLLKQVRERRIGALIATHNLVLAKRMDRILEISKGTLREKTDFNRVASSAK